MYIQLSWWSWLRLLIFIIGDGSERRHVDCLMLTLVGTSDSYDWSDNSSSAADRPSHLVPATATAGGLARSSHASRRPALALHRIEIHIKYLTFQNKPFLLVLTRFLLYLQTSLMFDAHLSFPFCCGFKISSTISKSFLFSKILQILFRGNYYFDLLLIYLI